jgi:hypothetical protein
MERVPDATLSLEVVDEMDVMMDDLRNLADHFSPKEP